MPTTVSPAGARGGSIARRVSIIGSASLALVLLGICALMSVLLSSNSRERTVTWVGDKAEAIISASDAFDMTSRETVERMFSVFKRDFDTVFEHNPETGELKNFGSPLNDNVSLVDQFQQYTGGVATIFSIKGDDFYRITTSLKKENGDRAQGTSLGKVHPAYALLMQGKPYVGRAVLFGKPYMTRYEPARDVKGKVVGALFIGFDLSPFQASLEKLAAQATFFETGGVTVIDPKKAIADAVFVVHPSAKGKKVTEVVKGVDDFLAKLAKAETGAIADAPSLLGQAGDGRWAVMRRSASTGWWVVAEVADAEAMAAQRNVLLMIWGLLGGAVAALGAGLWWTMRRNISQPLAELQDAVGAVAAGDLTRRFHSERRDEVGALIETVEAMRMQFHTALANVRASTDSINTASAEIATGNQDLSARTEQTASNLQQAASSMEQLTGTVKQSADSARQANQLASSAAEVAARGGVVVSQVVATMEDINASSKKIADIIGVIDGIAFQTNILALNAAVEAARAGEQGRGFAVVASEVRSLAQRSAGAAKEIKSLIGASVDRVETGARQVADAGATMREIESSVERVTAIISEISAAAAEQSSGIVQVGGSVQQLETMTQQNAALVEESAAAAESLRGQAESLNTLVHAFRLG